MSPPAEKPGRAGSFLLAVLAMLGIATGAVAAPPFPADVRHEDVPLSFVRAAVWFDADGDGRGDVAMADRTRVLRVFRGEDAGLIELPAGAVPALTGGGHALAAGDLDGDGDPDLVACSRTARRRRAAGGCTVLLNRVVERGTLEFDAIVDALAAVERAPRTLPLLADYDGDGDLDLLLFPAARGRPALVRNDRDGGVLAFTSLGGDPLAAARGARAAAVVDRNGRGTLLWIVRQRRPAALLALDAGGVYVDVARERGLPRRRTRGGLAAAGDVDGDGLTDVVLAGTGARALLFRQGAGGGFTETRLDAVPSAGVAALAVEDFDRDGRADLFVARRRGASSLLRNTAGPDGAPAFDDVTDAAGVGRRLVAAAAPIFRRAAACDDAIDLLVASGARTPSRLHRFADDSAGRTTAATAGATTVASRRGACVAGSDGADRLEGHRVASILDGGGADDTLVARAGVTVMRGGAGRDTFEANGGFALIHLPPEDVVAGEIVHCGLADAVWIVSPLSREQLEAAGVVLDHCFEDTDCDVGDDEFDVTCHGGHSRTTVTDFGTETPTTYQLLELGLDLGFASAYDFGFGDCTTNPQCYAIGLDVCRDAFGDIPSPPSRGSCYPSDFDGLEGPVAEWCHDPFWARMRYDQTRADLESDDRRLVLPIVVWLVRSDSATDAGGCTRGGHPSPPSIASWHDSFTTAMGGTAALFAQWGIAFDYAFRRLDVPDDSPFVVDPDDDACRVELRHSPADGDDARTIGKLLEAYPNAYRQGQVNVYLSDVPPPGQSNGSGVSWSSPVRFIILNGTAGALAHELGHEIGLAHPYDGNLAASGQEPDESESRDSWNQRPFPDDATNRLALCASNAACDGVDAPPGACRKAPDAPLGYCQNLKRDCAQNGDGICDTPWDAVPCFQGVGTKLLEACTTDADCRTENTFRGTSYLTACVASRCRRIECTTNADCDGGSWCAGGACVNYKDGFDACCDLYTDRRSGFVHDACWERRPNGTVVPVPGVGSSTTFPLRQNVMAYHKPRGLPRTLTRGQRDTVVCKMSYTTKYGQLQRVPRANGAPCTLRPGGNATTYGPVGVTRTVPHGACASGICQVTTNDDVTSATCVASACNDALVGANEASRDCGGVCPTACPTFRSNQTPSTSACAAPGDCASGVCTDDVCQPTCIDGVTGGSELAADAGGAGFATGCAPRPFGGTCRFDADCGAASCAGDGACLVDTDCPVNAPSVACDANDDCPGGACTVLLGICQAKSCALHAQCFSGICDPAAQRCRCSTDGECGVLDTCVVVESACTGECVDGRCLGLCELGLGGG